MSAEMSLFPLPRRFPFDPPEEYARFRKQPGLARVRLWDGQFAWLITRYDDVVEALSDSRFSHDPKAPGMPFPSASRAGVLKREVPPINSLDPPEHTRIRRALSSMFSFKRIKDMEPRIDEIVTELVDRMIASGAPADFVAAVALPLPTQMISAFLGVPYEDYDFFQQCATRRVEIDRTAEDALAAGEEMYDYLDRFLREKAQGDGEGDDLLTRLAFDKIRAGVMTHEEAIVNLRQLLLAGFETSANTIGMSVLLMLQHPAQRAKLKADPSLIDGAVDELLRYTSAAHLSSLRTATEDVEIGGQLIRAGEGIIASLSAANRDPSIFPDPDAVDVARDASRQVGFSFGIHQCIGQALARLEIGSVLRILFDKLPDLALAVGADEIVFKHTSRAYGIEALPVKW